MKTNLLFVINSLDLGGAEKSLVSLLNTIDFSMYNVDLLMFRQEGLFLKLLPDEVNILKVGLPDKSKLRLENNEK